LFSFKKGKKKHKRDIKVRVAYVESSGEELAEGREERELMWRRRRRWICARLIYRT
jgi:hypothetical protein